MPSGDRDRMDDPEWQLALAQHALSQRFNPNHRGTTHLEMLRGKQVAEQHARDGNKAPMEGPSG